MCQREIERERERKSLGRCGVPEIKVLTARPERKREEEKKKGVCIYVCASPARQKAEGRKSRERREKVYKG